MNFTNLQNQQLKLISFEQQLNSDPSLNIVLIITVINTYIVETNKVSIWLNLKCVTLFRSI